MDYKPLVIGWLLGLLSGTLTPLGVDWIRKRYRKEEILKGLFNELKEIRSRLAASVYLMSARYGTYDREFLECVHPICVEDAGIVFRPEMIQSLERLIGRTDEQIAEVAERERLTGEYSARSTNKKYLLPFLDSNMEHLSLFDAEFQRRAIQIRTHLNMLNEEAELGRFYYEKTFDSGISPENHEILCRNLDVCYRNIVGHSRTTADRITDLINNF